MEQRRLRLGDILDDYCPRERRVTNHAIVAMVEEDIKQTRCTTCDSEHAYKGARVPKRRKKDAPAALYKEVLAAMPEMDGAPALAAPAMVAAAAPPAMDIPETSPIDALPDGIRDTSELDIDDDVPADAELDQPIAANDERTVDEGEDASDAPAPVDEGPVHRPLIRATLPRPEGAQKEVRPVPEFTVRHNARGNGHGANHFRGDRVKTRGTGDARGRSGQGPNANGNRAQANPRFGRSGGRGGPQAGFRGGQPRHGGRKGRG
jgi:hypothetical protein